MCLIRTTWVQRIKAASERFIETEKLKREKAYQGSRGTAALQRSPMKSYPFNQTFSLQALFTFLFQHHAVHSFVHKNQVY